jgi:hypothetical protein
LPINGSLTIGVRVNNTITVAINQISDKITDLIVAVDTIMDTVVNPRATVNHSVAPVTMAAANLSDR